MIDRRTMIAAAAAIAAAPTFARVKAKVAVGPTFPKGFLWGASTAISLCAVLGVVGLVVLATVALRSPHLRSAPAVPPTPSPSPD